MSRKRLSKRMSTAIQGIDKSSYYSSIDAIKLLQASSGLLKFDPSFEAYIKIGLDMKKLGTTIRGMVSLPAGIGTQTSVAVICRDENKILEAKEAGADVVGGQDLIESIKAGNINFKICIATPDMMASIGSIARILGPKGLMPNPKLGTVTNNISQVVKEFKAGKVEFKVDKAGFINAKIGKASFSAEDINSNLSALLASISKAKPENTKGKYLSYGFVSYTMGPALKIKHETFS
jgi:large subunit ribosomal protein L1